MKQNTIEQADRLIAAALQAELIQQLTGLKPNLQTPATLGALLNGVLAAKQPKVYR